MNQTERAQRVAQLREQIGQLTEEVTRLEREDDQFVAYLERVQGLGKPPVSYADFVRYSSALEQLEQAWASAGRPRNWQQLPLLLRLREVLSEPSGGVTPTPAAPVSATPSNPPAAPGMARRLGSTPPAPPSQTPPTASAATSPPSRTAGSPAVSIEGLGEQHAPILTEVVALSKRAEEEFRSAQFAAGFASCDRATYLLERVAVAPPVLCQRIIKLIDDVYQSGSQLAEADQARADDLRERLQRLIASG